MSTHYQVDDRTLLAGILTHGAGFQSPAAVLEGLTAEQALAKPHGLPHSIAELVAHMWYWQDWFNRCAVDGFSTVPAHAPDGWPAVSPDTWDAVRARYLTSLEQGCRIAAESNQLGAPLLPPGVEIPFLDKESRGSGILHAAIHGSHHLGQIVTIRQLLGTWPPPAGSMTW